MSAFEFFFSFYGLLLGLSVAALAVGVATAIQHRKRIRIGRLTPLLGLFVILDIATFWDAAWVNFRHLPFSYGLLVAGLAVALIYFMAASLVFPHEIEDGMNLDDHFWDNKKLVLLLTTGANVLLVIAAVIAHARTPGAPVLLTSYAITLALYLVLVIPAAFAKRARLFVVLTVLHILVYLASAVGSAMNPVDMVEYANDQARAAATLHEARP